VHIGVDATCWDNNRGYGRQARALIRSLVRLDKANQYTLFFDAPTTHPPPSDCALRFVESSASAAVAASAKGRRSVRDTIGVSRAMSAARCDVLLYPTVYTFVPTFTRAKKVVFLHDVIAETFPQYTFATRRARLFWNTKVTLARWQADAVVTVSDYSKQCIARHFGMRPESIQVVGEAPDAAFHVIENAAVTDALAAVGVLDASQKVVYVGGFGAHKNLAALVDAFAKIAHRDSSQRLQLILVGEYRNEVFHTAYADLREQIDRCGLQDRVVFTGYLPDREVAILLNLADALVLPSFMEGYGLPAVEAAACGCPVIATNRSPLAGILERGALSVEPDTREIEAALGKILESESLRADMRQAGLTAARSLTWDAAAQQMMDVLQNLSKIGEPHARSAKNDPTDAEVQLASHQK